MSCQLMTARSPLIGPPDLWRGADRDERLIDRVKPTEHLIEKTAIKRNASSGGSAVGDVQEDRRATTRNDRSGVVSDHREMSVEESLLPECLAPATEGGRSAARNAHQGVIGGRRRIGIPPIATLHLPVGAVNRKRRPHTEDLTAETEHTDGCRSIAFMLVRRGAAVADVSAHRTEHRVPTAIVLFPGLERGGRCRVG